MCGRFNINQTPGLQSLLEALGTQVTLANQYNIAPTESVPVIYEAEGRRSCHPARWWLTPAWSSGPDTRFSMFNARAETLEKSRAFKGPFRHRRCVIPCTSFVEWKTEGGHKQPWEIFRPDGAIAFAGLWDLWGDELLSCCIVTTAASEALSAIHNRMPVMLDRAGCDLWLDTAQPTDQLAPLMQADTPHPLSYRPVHTSINNARHKVLPEPL